MGTADSRACTGDKKVGLHQVKKVSLTVCSMFGGGADN